MPVPTMDKLYAVQVGGQYFTIGCEHTDEQRAKLKISSVGRMKPSDMQIDYSDGAFKFWPYTCDECGRTINLCMQKVPKG